MESATSNSCQQTPQHPEPYLPENPQHPYYLKVCYGCQEPAKPNQVHTPHYGGTVCLSCRAFFRRAHQAAKFPIFFCKYSNNCTVTVKNRRRCQKCRYDRCIKAGMSPEGVLSETQKKIRFRKLIQKRKKSGQRLPKFAGTEAGKGESDFTDDDDDVEAVAEDTYQFSNQVPFSTQPKGFGEFY